MIKIATIYLCTEDRSFSTFWDEATGSIFYDFGGDELECSDHGEKTFGDACEYIWDSYPFYPWELSASEEMEHYFDNKE